ncbi:MAG: response regulator transcription factor [Bacteroidetes bacterium]|nr:response regulator transcription factor [Bacteroidota bacterium]
MNSLIKGLIVDDELSGRENLKILIESYCTEIKVVGTASSAVEAKKMIEYLTPDVVFLDVNMPVLDGFDLLESVDSSKFMVVFVTAHDEYAIKAIKAKAIDYLLKPINIKELQQAVKRLINHYYNNGSVIPPDHKEKVILPVSHGFKVVNADEIIRLEAEDCYTHIFTVNEKKITVSKTLKEFEDKISGNVFFRVHKSHLINLGHIKDYSKLDGGCITMSDGAKIHVSRRKGADFTEKYKEFIMKR